MNVLEHVQDKIEFFNTRLTLYSFFVHSSHYMIMVTVLTSDVGPQASLSTLHCQ